MGTGCLFKGERIPPGSSDAAIFTRDAKTGKCAVHICACPEGETQAQCDSKVVKCNTKGDEGNQNIQERDFATNQVCKLYAFTTFKLQ